jgi:hypothetical protein
MARRGWVPYAGGFVCGAQASIKSVNLTLEALDRKAETVNTVNPAPDAWVFPSEKMTMPLAKDNCWRRQFKARLAAVELGWVNFQVMRKTHSCIGPVKTLIRRFAPTRWGTRWT